MLLNFAPVVAHEHFLHRGFLEFLASTARIRNKKKEGEEETSQHPPFFSLEEGRQRERKREGERWEDRRQEAEGKKHSCALLPRRVSDTSRVILAAGN